MACCGQLQLLSVPPIVNRPSTRHRNPSPKISPVQFFPSSKISAVQSFPAFSSTSKNPKPFPYLESGRKNTLALALTSIFASASAGGLLLSGGGGGGAFGGGGGGFGGGGGNGGGGFWSWLFPGLSANAKEEEKAEGSPEWDSHGLPANLIADLRKLSGMKRYKISEILFFDRRRRSTAAGADDPFSEMLSLLPGGVYTKSQLQVELETLGSSGMFEKVDLEAKTKPDGTLGLTVSYTEATWPSADAFRCINVGSLPQMQQVEMDPDMTDREKFEYVRSQERDYRKRIQRTRACLLPVTVQREVQQMLREYGKVSAGLLRRIHDRVLKWYHDEGYACAKVVNFGNLTSREVVCEVVEGDITQLAIQFEDNLGNVVEGDTQLGIIRRELPYLLNKGHVFNIEAAKQGLRNLNSLSLFSNIEVNPRPDEKNEGGIIVDIKLKEMKQKSTEVNTEWNIVPGQNGWPALGSIQPGGTVTYEHRNIKGLNRSLVASINSSNLLNPQDDLSYKFEYVHPYLDGVHNPRNRTFRVSCFNNRKMSPVFTSGAGVDEVPPVWIDREGIKANITENFTSQSKLTYGLVMEEIKTCDETNSLCTHGTRKLPTGDLSMHGPPTTLSGTGVDRMAFAQANITRDNTKFVNGAIVGDRNVFQVDQGLGIGSKFPFFNHHQLSLTKFIQLKKVEEGAGKPPPPTLVLHGNYGGCVGDLPSYDAFTLGGPYSVRGYNMGELGACRNKLELAAELRVPVKNNIVYAFAEHGNDLGSSKNVKGNPTEFFQRVGHGSSYGVGTKFGPVRMEYVVDHNTGKGSVVLRFGERF